MAERTKIEWTDATWNPVTGCTKISPGCAHCYAEVMARRQAGRNGYPADEPFRVTLRPERLEEPLRWRKPRRIFVCSMADLFHDQVPEKFIAKVFAIMDLARQHTYLVLTKRPERMRSLISDEDFQFHVGWFQSQAVREFGLPEPDRIGPWPLGNVWVGVTAEDQRRADERIPLLLQVPAAVRFLSCEPLLGPIQLSDPDSHDWLGGGCGCTFNRPCGDGYPGLDWVIAGGESGPGARPMSPYWARSLRDQCQVAGGVPFFFKQWGEWLPLSSAHGGPGRWSSDGTGPYDGKRIAMTGDRLTSAIRVGKSKAGRLLDGRAWDEFPLVARPDSERT